MIKSIKSTWKHDKNYSEIIDMIKSGNDTDKNQSRADFEFVINNKYTYHYLSDFKNKNAKEAYKKVIAIEKAINDNNDQLADLREMWIKADAKKKETLKTEILKKEETANNLMISLEKSMNEVRKEEQKMIK